MERKFARQVLAGLDSDERREAYVEEHGHDGWEQLVAAAELTSQEKYSMIASPEVSDPRTWTVSEKIRYIKQFGLDSFVEAREKARSR